MQPNNLYGVPRQAPRRGWTKDIWWRWSARSRWTLLRRSTRRVRLHLSTRPCWMSVGICHPGQGI